MDVGGLLYLDLLKRCLTNWIYGHTEVVSVEQEGSAPPDVLRMCRDLGFRLVQPTPFSPGLRADGRDWPPTAHSMVGLKRLDNLQSCATDVLAKGIPGDFIETGVWRGGASIFLRAVLKVHGVSDRRVWVADSFEGLPPPDPNRYPRDAGDKHHVMKFLAISIEEVKANFERYGLLDQQVQLLKGWFRDTLPIAPIRQLALMRLDGDMYESTMDALVHLYPKLSPGGYVIVDDYGAIPACQQAVQDFRTAQGIREEIHQIDWTGVYWQRAQ